MNDVIPFKTNHRIEANGGKGLLNMFSGLSLDQNSLIPILFIFMTNKNGAGLDILNNGLNLKNGFGGIFSKLNLSSENIQRSLKTLNDIKPLLGQSNNSPLIGTFSTVLETIYKVNTIQELTSGLNSFSSQSSNRDKNEDFNNSFKSSNMEVNYKIIDAISELLDGETKNTIKQAGDMMKTMTMLRDMTNVFGGEENPSKGFNMGDILGLVKPLMGGSQNGGFTGMEDIMKMMDMFSMFNNTGNSNKSDGNKEYNAKVTSHPKKKKKRFNKENVIDIQEYDEETGDDDRIDELLDGLMADES